jgi:hypothetical protein
MRAAVNHPVIDGFRRSASVLWSRLKTTDGRNSSDRTPGRAIETGKLPGYPGVPPGTDAAFIMSDSALISSMNISRNVVHDRFARGQRQIDAAQQRESRIEIAR